MRTFLIVVATATITAVAVYFGMTSGLVERFSPVAFIGEKIKTAPAASPPAKPQPLTPPAFGYYVLQEGKLIKLEQMATKKYLSMDLTSYTDAQSFVLPNGVVSLVLYDRTFSSMVPPDIFVHIVGNIRNVGTWFVRNRGYKLQLIPRADNRDIVETGNLFPPGRYAISMHNTFYTFTVAGSNDDPDHCLLFNESIRSLKLCDGSSPF